MFEFCTGDLNKIEEALEHCTKGRDSEETLMNSVHYSLTAGGKRLRPLLTLEFCRLCGGTTEDALPFACAVEMIHTYSLIHDDMPCMDNDDMRRGRKTNHKVYGEGMALIAGDALQAMAFESMLSPQTVAGVGAQKAARAAYTLAYCAGECGMVGGQAIDLCGEGKALSLPELERMDSKKTGALIRAAVKMGCIIGGATEAQEKAALVYAENFGIAFQIEDDLLDVLGNAKEMGKNTGSDAAKEKSTYVSLLGVDKARAAVEKLTAQAIAALAPFGEKAKGLCELAEKLQKRRT